MIPGNTVDKLDGSQLREILREVLGLPERKVAGRESQRRGEPTPCQTIALARHDTRLL
jgi:hypothetical protein